MGRGIALRGLVIVLVFAWVVGEAQGIGRNLLANPSFEVVSEEGQIEGWELAGDATGEMASVSKRGLLHSDWRGKVHSGGHAALLQATEAEGQQQVRLVSRHVRAKVGLRYGLAIWCKGSGSIRLGVLQNFRKRRDKPSLQEDWQEQPTALTDQWQKLTFDTCTANPDVTRICLLVEVQGERGTAYLDDTAIRLTGQIVVTPPYAMVKRGDTFSFEVTARKRGWKVGVGSLKVVTRTSEGAAEEELGVDLDGVTEYRFAADPTAEIKDGLVQLDFSSEELGASSRAFLHIVDEETYDKFATAAARTKIELPAHLLFIGDSLSDFRRDHNYTDEVAFWLRQVHGEQVTYRNAGVGGDFITRVWQRLTGSPRAYRLAMYDELYTPRPTRVFILLGHNDSKLRPKAEYTSPDDYEEPVVSLEDYKKYQKMAIERIRSETGAEFTLISNTSSVYEVCAQRAIDRIAAGKSGGSLFGKPEAMEQFNAVLRKVAAETGSRYLDVYEPTRTYPDKPSLFTADGVHLNAQGNFLVALEILEHLGE